MTESLTATLATTQGTVTVRLFPDHAPNTVRNFVELAEGGREWTNPVTRAKTKDKLYDGTIFHRVITGFMIQGGDPLGVGRGGPGYEFQNENDPSLVFDKGGVLAMANAGRDTNGSQFFITETPQPALNGGYTIFGQCEPVDLVAKIARVERSPADKPVKDVKMTKVTISRGKPAKAAAGKAKADKKAEKPAAEGAKK